MITITESFLKIEIDLFMGILLSIVIIHSILQLNLKLISYKLFTAASLCCLTSLFIEIITSLARDFSIINSYEIIRFLNALSFAVSPYTPLFIYYFVVKTTTGIFNERRATIISIPALINVFISILSYKYNIYFYISAANIYSRGPWYFISPVITIYYYLLIIIHVVRNIIYLEKDDMFAFLAAVLIPFLLGAIQIINSLHLTVCASYVLSMVILYIFILSDNSKRDAMTGLGNKTKYYDYINMFKKKHLTDLKVLSFDLDDFKNINDTYGHSQGDIAIQEFASLLYQKFKVKSQIIRFGGDEFIVFTFNNNVYSLLRSFDLEIYKLNTSNVIPFKLKYSYGIADSSKPECSGLSIEDLIKKSDDSLYINKKMKKEAEN